MLIGPRLPANTEKYGYNCEHDRFINNRRYTFRVHKVPKIIDGYSYYATRIYVIKWDDKDMYVEEERNIIFNYVIHWELKLSSLDRSARATD